MTNNYADYTYQVQVRIDSDSGEITAFITGIESGEVGSPVQREKDADLALALGRQIILDARKQEHGWDGDAVMEFMSEAVTGETGGRHAECSVHGSFYSGYTACPVCSAIGKALAMESGL